MSGPISRAKGFVFEKPDGVKRFVAHVFFDDQAVRRRGIAGFDGMERVQIDFARSNDVEPERASYRGSTPGYWPIDVHTVAIDLGRGIDLAKLLDFGFSAAARIRADHGPQLLDLGRHHSVDDVGKVDERGIAWMSSIRHSSWYFPAHASEVPQGGTFQSAASLRLEVDVFAPELTPLGATDPKRVSEALDIRVECDAIKDGRFHYSGQSGIDGNDIRLSWSSMDGLPPGDHTLRFFKGSEQIGEATVHVLPKPDR